MLISFENCLSLIQKLPHYLPSNVHSSSWFVFVLFPVFGRCSSRLRDYDFQRHSNVWGKATFSLGKKGQISYICTYVCMLFIIILMWTENIKLKSIAKTPTAQCTLHLVTWNNNYYHPDVRKRLMTANRIKRCAVLVQTPSFQMMIPKLGMMEEQPELTLHIHTSNHLYWLGAGKN